MNTLFSNTSKQFSKPFENEWLPSFSDCNSDEYPNSSGYHYSFATQEFKRNELSVKVDNGYLIITGNKATDKWLSKNYYQANFTQSIKLNDKMDSENIKAKLKNGVLKIEIPIKKEYISNRMIPVNGPSTNKPNDNFRNEHKNGLWAGIKAQLTKIFNFSPINAYR